MTARLPALPLSPLERLHATDGLLLSADLWERAHAYHRQRQNVHYQALHQAGIVGGLGVSAVAAPDEIAAQYRDRRWLRVQPGLAIDATGNPIVVDRPIDFRIASSAETEPLTVYLVASYVDPDRLQRQNSSALVQESFRIDEKTSPPAAGEIELCRLQLPPGQLSLANPQDVLQPGLQEVDLRYRPVAQPRAHGQVCLGTLPTTDPRAARRAQHCRDLLAALPALYPALSAAGPPLVLDLPGDRAALADCDLVYLTRSQYLDLAPAAQASLQAYLRAGGNLLIELPDDMTNIDDLKGVIQEIEEALADIGSGPEFADMRQELNAELAACRDNLAAWLEALNESLAELLTATGATPGNTGRLDRQHPLRHQPFLFAQWPRLTSKPMEILNWGGVTVAIGDLALGWGLDDELLRPRQTIRAAQELGINLLHFAWQRRELTQLLHLPPSES